MRSRTKNKQRKRLVKELRMNGMNKIGLEKQIFLQKMPAMAIIRKICGLKTSQKGKMTFNYHGILE